jgi:hypothetical protein
VKRNPGQASPAIPDFACSIRATLVRAALTRPDANRRDRHSRLQSHRLHEQPFEISRRAFALRRRRDGEVVAARFRAIGPRAEQAAAVGDEADAVIAGGIGAFHDTLMRHAMAGPIVGLWVGQPARREVQTRWRFNEIGIYT